MIGLPFITELFQSILTQSRTVQGRLFYLARGGAEVNAEDFDAVISQSFESPADKKYPVAFLLPPLSRGFFTDAGGEWETYNVTMFFLTSTFYDADGTKAVNPDTQTSTHTIQHDQHDCGRAARNFILVLDRICRRRGLVQRKIQYLGKDAVLVTPVALLGVDRLSGVRLDFPVRVFNGCTLEDYSPDGIEEIVVPQDDPHPEH